MSHYLSKRDTPFQTDIAQALEYASKYNLNIIILNTYSFSRYETTLAVNKNEEQ
jgi:hypothetical protein